MLVFFFCSAEIKRRCKEARPPSSREHVRNSTGRKSTGRKSIQRDRGTPNEGCEERKSREARVRGAITAIGV